MLMEKTQQPMTRSVPLTEAIRVYAPVELKELAFVAAESTGVPLTEWVVRLIARELDRPDLAIIPRLRRGPKKGKKRRKQAVAG
jgi:hypothetical protein